MSDKPAQAANAKTRRFSRAIILLVIIVILAVPTAFQSGFTCGVNLSNRPATFAVVSITRMQGIVGALEMFRSDAGRYPSEAEGLSILERTVLRGPYLVPNSGGLIDAWGTPFGYRNDGQGPPRLIYYGADHQAGGVLPGDADLEIGLYGATVAPKTQNSP